MEVTNYAPGPRGVNMEGGVTLWVNPGETMEIDESKMVGGKDGLPDFGDASAPTPQVDALQAQIAALQAQLAAVQPVAKPVSLTNKSKDQLLKIASDEGVTTAKDENGADIAIADGTNPQIADAITAKRNAA